MVLRLLLIYFFFSCDTEVVRLSFVFFFVFVLFFYHRNETNSVIALESLFTVAFFTLKAFYTQWNPVQLRLSWTLSILNQTCEKSFIRCIAPFAWIPILEIVSQIHPCCHLGKFGKILRVGIGRYILFNYSWGLSPCPSPPPHTQFITGRSKAVVLLWFITIAIVCPLFWCPLGVTLVLCYPIFLVTFTLILK